MGYLNLVTPDGRVLHCNKIYELILSEGYLTVRYSDMYSSYRRESFARCYVTPEREK